MRQTNKIMRKVKLAYAIIGDGASEYWYFSMIKRNHPELNVRLKPELPTKNLSLAKQYKKVVELSDEFDKVFWIIDFDVINKESREHKKGSKAPLEEFKNYFKKFEHSKKITVVVNNPCLEYWFLLHFEPTGKFFQTCESASKQLLTHVPPYEKTEKFFTMQTDIYKRLKPNLVNAIQNAKNLGAFDFENSMAGTTEMYKFFEEIFPKQTS